MAISSHTLDLLHHKFIAGTITDKERAVLYSNYQNLFKDSNGNIDYDMLNEFLLVSHKSYGKSKKGITEIV